MQKLGRAPLLVLLVCGLALLLAVILVPMTATAGHTLAAAPEEVAQAGRALDPSVIKTVLYTLKDEYVEKVNYDDLLKTAAKGINIYLDEKKLTWPALKNFPPPNQSADANTEAIEKAITQIEQKYKGKVNDQHLIYYALKGLMYGLKDPYSVAMEPKEFHHLKEQMSGGNFGGVGIYIELDRQHHNQLEVIEPIEDTPGAKAGLKPGDWILSINGQSTKGIDLEVAANRIRGPEGSHVKLLIKHKGADKEQMYDLVREKIHVKSATGKMLGDGIGYIRLRMFGEETGAEVESALNNLEKKGDKALIIDLRSNGGGYITAARDVCNLFLPAGQVITSVVSHRRNTDEVHRATGSNYKKVPMVILINQFSASASEITAGALHDTHTATLIGVKSFGKGSVQTLHELPDGGALKFTIAHYLTPNGTNINKKGIKPDIEVKMDLSKVGAPNGDVQLQKAIAYLKKKIH